MKPEHDIFLSAVVVIHNQSPALASMLREASQVQARCAFDYELVIVDNGSTDDTLALLSSLCGDDGIPNLQVDALTKKVAREDAAWAGIESALGDYVAVIDPAVDDLQALPLLLEQLSCAITDVEQ